MSNPADMKLTKLPEGLVLDLMLLLQMQVLFCTLSVGQPFLLAQLLKHVFTRN